MPTREEMIVVLKNIVVRILREKGFAGAFPHFRHLNPNDRLRLGYEGPSTDDWFRYDRGKSPDVVALEVVNNFDNAEKWWAG